MRSDIYLVVYFFYNGNKKYRFAILTVIDTFSASLL